jgi:hypothetical protein
MIEGNKSETELERIGRDVMEQIKKILAPTDLSELSKIGVRYALQLAKAIGV